MTTAPCRKIALAAMVGLAQLAGSAAAAQTRGELPLTGGVSRPAAGQPNVAVVGAQSGWVKGYNSTSRLIAGAQLTSTGERQLLAGVEIRLNDGWKTYWRHPGDDGGLPPSFTWTGSRNLKNATVLYPLPERIKSLNGTTIGYSKAVVYPVEIVAVDRSLPVELSLTLEYGICREICVPAEAKLALVIEPELSAMPTSLAASLAKVPRKISGTASSQLLRSAAALLSGPAPGILFDITIGGNGANVDLFVEGPQGIELPVPAKSGAPTGGVQRFRIELKGVENAAQLAGKRLVLTVSGPAGASELSWVVQ